MSRRMAATEVYSYDDLADDGSVTALLKGRSGDDTLRMIFDLGSRSPDEAPPRMSTDASIAGSAGDDFLWIDSVVHAELDAHAGSTLTGGAGADILAAHSVAEVDYRGDARVRHELSGSTGNDVVAAKAAAIAYGSSSFGYTTNLLTGGSGNDVLSAESSAMAFDGDADAIIAMAGGSGDDFLIANAFSNAEFGGTAENHLEGGSGNDILRSSAEVSGNSEASSGQTLCGGGGNDVLEAKSDARGEWGSSENTLTGCSGDDVLYVYARHEAATFYSGSRAGQSSTLNVVDGGSGDDLLNVTGISKGDDTAEVVNRLAGGRGDDLMTATGEAIGRNGATVANVMDGGSGDDELTATATGDWGDSGVVSSENVLYGGKGDDLLTATATVRANGAIGIANNQLDGGAGNDTLLATISDSARGSSSLYGGKGCDILEVRGGAGNILDGGSGDDWLVGGSGDDFMTGGTRADTFVFNVAEDFGTDTIRDFDLRRDSLVLDGHADVPTVTDDGAGGDLTLDFDAGGTLILSGLGGTDLDVLLC